MKKHSSRMFLSGILALAMLLPSVSTASALSPENTRVLNLLGSALLSMQDILTQLENKLNELKASVATDTPSTATETDVATDTPVTWAKGRILVAPKAGLSLTDFDKILKAHGASRGHEIAGIHVHIVNLPKNANEQAVAEALSHNPNIKFAEVDEIMSPSYTPNDPYFSYNTEWGLKAVQAPQAWDTTKGAGVTIAILDSGVNCTYADLTNCVSGWNFYDNTSNTADVTGHGTSVASAAAEIGDNGIGYAGVSYQSKIMPVRITDTSGYAYWSTAASAITYAADHGAKIVNLSYAGSPTTWTSSVILSAAQYLQSKGGLLFVAEGNTSAEDTSASVPPSSMMVVSALDTNNSLASFSTWGPATSMAAPGNNVACLLGTGQLGYCYGTSFASPITAAVGALMLAANPQLTSAQIMTTIENTATRLGSGPYPNLQYGYGMPNAAAAVVLAASTTVPIDTQAPSVSVDSPANGSTVSGNVPVSVSASDNTAVTKVELYANGVLIGTDTSAPYSFSWNSASVSDGSATLSAKAYDAAGNVGTSAAVSVTVKNSVTVDTSAPVVTITKPANGTKLASKGTTAVSVTATDNVAVTSIKLYVDSSLVKTAAASPLNYSLNNSKTKAGTHTLTAVAFDGAGNSSSVSIAVTK